MDISKKLKDRRKELNLTMLEVAQKTGVSEATVSRWESGDIANMRRDKFVLLANALQVSPSFIMGWDESNKSETAIPDNFDIIKISEKDFAMVPVVGTISAGIGCLAEQRFEERELVYLPDLKGTNLKDYFYLKVQGDSMYPMLVEGDLALIRKQTSVDSGSYAAVMIDSQEGVLKKVIYGSDWIELQSVNPMYPPRRFEGKDVTRISIVGLVKQIKRDF